MGIIREQKAVGSNPTAPTNKTAYAVRVSNSLLGRST